MNHDFQGALLRPRKNSKKRCYQATFESIYGTFIKYQFNTQAVDIIKLHTGNGYSPFFTMNIDSGLRSAESAAAIDVNNGPEYSRNVEISV